MGNNDPAMSRAATPSIDHQQRIQQLEAELHKAKLELARVGLTSTSTSTSTSATKPYGEHSDIALLPASPVSSFVNDNGHDNDGVNGNNSDGDDDNDSLDLSLHFLLILADSALPLGSFAFSSGLESYLTHSTTTTTTTTTTTGSPRSPNTLLRRFLSLSLNSLASTTLPFITAAYKSCNSCTATESGISSILSLSDTFDAITTCPVLRRASTTQGKALLSVWEKSLRSTSTSTTRTTPMPNNKINLPTIISSYKKLSPPDSPPHLPIAWSLICFSYNLSLHQTTFVFLLNHTKALLSAAVRLNLIGPYIAQKILAAPETLDMIRKEQKMGMQMEVDEAGQTIPTLDLYGGRHELLYSRVFNS